MKIGLMSSRKANASSTEPGLVRARTEMTPPDVLDAYLEGDGGFESARDQREYDAAWKALTRRCPKR